ncbi:MAG: hypothetical protein JEZ07_06505 [Phycisphaerae bacterium]|nr:hypothetical protein [Phycisphaerae bacterium]
MGQVKFTLDADEAKAVKGYLKLIDAQSRAERGARKVDKANKTAGDQIADSNKKSIEGFAKMALGLVTVGGAVAAVSIAWRAVQDDIANVIRLQKQYAQAIMTESQSVHSYAIQKGYDSQEGGMDKAYAELNALRREGKYKNVQDAASAGIAGDIAFGYLGQKDQNEILKTVGVFSQQKQLDENAVSSVVGILGDAKVQNKDDALKILDKLVKAQLESKSKKPTNFLAEFGPLFSESSAMGQGLDSTLGQFTRSVNIFGDGKEARAAERARQARDYVSVDKVIKAVRNKNNLSEEDYYANSLEDRQQLTRQWFADASDSQRNNALSQEQRKVAATMWNAASIQKQNKLENEFSQANPVDLQKSLDNYLRNNPIAKINDDLIEGQLIETSGGFGQLRGQTFLDTEKKKLDKSDSEGKSVGESVGRWAVELGGQDITAQRVAMASIKKMYNETSGLPRYGYGHQPGFAKDSPYYALGSDIESKIKEYSPSSGDPFTATEAGEILLLLDEMKNLRLELEKNNTATENNTKSKEQALNVNAQN